ncbi:MAG TPA: AAA family ATPase [Paludibacter sp.]
MRIKSIEIQNFRCLDQLTLDLAQDVTVLIGKNGAGKSSLIQAIKHGLSFVFSKDSKVTMGQYAISVSSPSLNIIGYAPEDAFYDFEKNDYQYPISIKCFATIGVSDRVDDWELLKNTAGGKLLYTKFRDAFDKFRNYHEKEQILPVLAYFSDSYPHVKTNLGSYAKTMFKSSKPVPQNFGYYQWDQESSSAQIWQKRFIQTWNQLKNEQLSQLLDTDSSSLLSDNKAIYGVLESSKKSQENKEIQYVSSFLKMFSKSTLDSVSQNPFEIKRIYVAKRLGKEFVELELMDGSKVPFELLPMGYKRLYYIVFELAYRAYIINRGAVAEPSGIVIIDEVDLHLHPSLEQEVLLRFQRTFPKIQWIVSTHSPLVISNLEINKNCKVVQMEMRNQRVIMKDLPDIFGVDYNSVISDFMDTPARNSLINYLENAYVRLIRINNSEKAEEYRLEIQKLVSPERFTMIMDQLKTRLS